METYGGGQGAIVGLNGIVSIAGAEAQYGVRIDPGTLEIDRGQPEMLRKDITGS